MNSWRTIGQIGFGFGIISVVFAAFAAFVDYQLNTIQYAIIPSNFIMTSALEAMLPYLLLAVLSFTVAGVTMRKSSAKTDEKIEAHTEPTPTEETYLAANETS
jgi:hypothetical protein